jgi:hypothetical protein
MGGLDWFFTMLVMWLANFACVGLIRVFAAQQVAGLSGAVSLGQIWWALAVFMGTQVVAGLLRVQSKTGVWKVLKQQQPQDISS